MRIIVWIALVFHGLTSILSSVYGQHPDFACADYTQGKSNFKDMKTISTFMDMNQSLKSKKAMH